MIGLGVTYFAASIVNYIVINQFMLNLSLTLRKSGVAVAIFVSFVLPLCAIIGPLYEQSKVSLVDALSIFRVRINQFSVSMTRMSDKLGLSPTALGIGIILTGFGIISYYTVPYYFLTE